MEQLNKVYNSIMKVSDANADVLSCDGQVTSFTAFTKRVIKVLLFTKWMPKINAIIVILVKF